MARKELLYQILAAQKPKTIVEVGTWNGLNAIAMASVALKYNPSVHYYGFDLFEDLTDAQAEEELNLKPRASLQQVQELLEVFKERNPGFSYTLIKGNTRDTLKDPGPWSTADFAFIDGGHSVETVRNDFEALKNCKAIVLDDYYIPDEQGNCVDTTKYGCNELCKTINAVMLPDGDPNTLGGKVTLAIYPAEACPFPVKLQVQTKNCVPDSQIHANIKYSTTVVTKWTPCCRLHNNTAVVVSAGESYKDYLEQIKLLAQDKTNYIFCVKTNHNFLIEQGIVPFGCILLDPRAKIKRFITPHDDVHYFAASVVHPSTIDLLRNYKLYLYNAVVGASEMPLLQQASNDPRSKRIIGGGSTAAARAIPVLKLLGFYKFKFFGYDSCYRTPQDPHATTKDGQKKFWQVEKYGKKFWTSLEMLAQVQDFENYFSHIIGDPGFEMEFYGDGIIPHVYKHVALPYDDFQEEFK